MIFRLKSISFWLGVLSPALKNQWDSEMALATGFQEVTQYSKLKRKHPWSLDMQARVCDEDAALMVSW